MNTQNYFESSLDYQKAQVFPNQLKMAHHQQQQSQPEQIYSNAKYNAVKDLVVSVNENYPIVYNLQPTPSFENSSSRSLIETEALLRNNYTDGKLANSTPNTEEYKDMDSLSQTTNDFDRVKMSRKYRKDKIDSSKVSINSESRFKSDSSGKYMSSKQKANNQKQKTNSNKSFLSCYIIQLYFIYLILCTIIVGCSFGFYYTIVSTNLKIDFWRKNLATKCSNSCLLGL